MSASEKAAGTTATTEDMVREYLVDNSDFLQRNPDLMDHLHIEHASGGAVSLVEKQVGILRERNIDMRRRLSTLSGHAKDNDDLFEQTSELVLKLLEADSAAQLAATFKRSLCDDFQVEYASVILFGDRATAAAGLRVEDPHSARQKIGALLPGGPMCGPLREQELNYLFPAAGAVGSAAIMPLGANTELGLIAVGSSDANHYHRDMGTLFLGHIASVIQRLLPRLEHSGAS